jgi:hypothetical protein
MFYAQIHKLDKIEKSGKLWGPIAGLQLCFLMGYTSGDHLRCEYTVSGNRKNGKNRKNGSRKFSESTNQGKNRPERVKTPPLK